MFDPSLSYYLQLVGRPCTGDAHSGSGQPLGHRLFLQCGVISDQGDGLGLTNRSPIPLPEMLLQGRWLVEAYALHADPTGGEAVCYFPLSEALLLNRPRLPLIPPGALQPALRVQPMFYHWQLERNPCPGWLERVHLYQNPGKPFEASAVLYLDQRQQIAAAELFQIHILQEDGSKAKARRVWVHFTDYRTS